MQSRLAVVLIVLFLGYCQGLARYAVANEYPIIGILAQEQSYYLEGKYPGLYNSFIAASYVRSVEASGSRVVPIWIGKDRSYYESIMSKINGIVFPGGATFFNQSDGYADAGEHIFKIAKEMNDLGNYFPLWGTCLGFQLLIYLDAGRIDVRADCHSQRVSLPLDFVDDFRNSRLFSRAPDDVIKTLANEDVTGNFHQYCITEKILRQYSLDYDWKVLSVNNDDYGFEFISTFEHTRYPFYGVQFHPEKVAFEWIRNRGIARSPTAVKANQYFMDFFVSEARKNFNAFASVQEERLYSIQNYPSTFTALVGSSYDACYMFE